MLLHIDWVLHIIHSSTSIIYGNWTRPCNIATSFIMLWVTRASNSLVGLIISINDTTAAWCMICKIQNSTCRPMVSRYFLCFKTSFIRSSRKKNMFFGNAFLDLTFLYVVLTCLVTSHVIKGITWPKKKLAIWAQTSVLHYNTKIVYRNFT